MNSKEFQIFYISKHTLLLRKIHKDYNQECFESIDQDGEYWDLKNIY